MVQEAKQTSVAVRPTQDFKPLPELGRPGGEKDGKAGSADIQFFEEVSTGERWIGKCGLSAMTRLHVLRQTQQHYEAQYKRARYFDEYREAIGLALYQAIGITTPEVVVSLQLPAKVSADQERSLGDMLEYHQPCLHLMTKFVTGFQVLGKPFITAYQQTSDKSKLTTVTTLDGEELVLKGLGAALAMGCFLHDADCLGGGGANMGYVVHADEQCKKYAQLVKIDAGTAFSFLEGDAGIYAHDPRKRDMFFGLQASFILRYDQLSVSDQLEFAHTARQILQIPQAVFKSIIDQGVVSDGFTQKQADRILNELVARKSTFLNGFAPEVSEQLKAEVQAARQALLTSLAAAPVAAASSANSVAIAVEGKGDNKDEEEEKMPNAQMALAQLDAMEERAIQNALALEEQRMQGERPEDRAVCRMFQPPAVSAHFTGRVEALASISQTLEAKQGSVVTQSISGLGGVGKTQLAAQYARLASEGNVCYGKQPDGEPLRYQAVIWLNAERSLNLQFIMLAETWCGLEKPKVEKAVAAVYRYLQNKRTLLVFDNAVDSQSIAPYLPLTSAQQSFFDRFRSAFSSRNCHILITSRNADWGLIPSLNLSGFTAEEAMTFVRKRLPDASETDIKTLVGTVTNLPLALSHAVAYIFEGYCSLQEYPQQFALHQLSLGHPISAQGVADHTVLTTFLLTFVRLKQRYPVTIPILHTCAYLASEGIPTVWLEAGLAGVAEDKNCPSMLGKFDLVEVQEGLAVLQRHGLLQFNKPEFVNMHQLVQQVIRYQLAPSERYQMFLRTATYLLFLDSEECHDSLAKQHAGAFVKHLEAIVVSHEKNICDDDIIYPVILSQLSAYYLLTIKQLNRCNQEKDQAVLTLLKLSDTLELIAIKNRSCFSASDHVTERQEHLENALIIKEIYYGQEHYQVANTLINLSIVYGDLGQFAKGLEILERACNILSTYDGQEPDKVIDIKEVDILANLGKAYVRLKDPMKGRKQLEHVLAIKEAHYGSDHYETSVTLTDLSEVYDHLGEVVKQRQLLERILRIREVHYGRNHYEIAVVLVNLSDTYSAEGGGLAKQKQRDLLERALFIVQAYYGPVNSRVATVLEKLGHVYGALGDPVKERDRLERALSIAEKCFTRDHYSILRSLASVYYRSEYFGKSQHLLERALQIVESDDSLDHYKVADVLWQLGYVHRALGNMTEQQRNWERVLAIREAIYGGNHHELVTTLTNLGAICGDLVKGRGLLERALVIQEAYCNSDHDKMFTILVNLGNAYTRDPAKKRDTLERALAIQKMYRTPNHHEIAITLTNLGNAYADLGDIERQRNLLGEALAITEADYGHDHSKVGIVLINLANSYDGDIIKQQSLLERARKIQRKSNNQDTERAAMTLASLADVYYKQRQPELALQTAREAYRILMANPFYATGHYKEECLRYLQSTCNFTLKDLQSESNTAEIEEEKSFFSAAAPTPPPLAPHHNMANRDNDLQEAYQRLGKAVLALLAAIETQRKPSWYETEHINFTVTVMNALANGREAFENLCLHPEQASISPSLARFIQHHIDQHPELRELSIHPNFVRTLRNQLNAGKLDELYIRFNVPKTFMSHVQLETVLRPPVVADDKTIAPNENKESGSGQSIPALVGKIGLVAAAAAAVGFWAARGQGANRMQSCVTAIGVAAVTGLLVYDSQSHGSEDIRM